MSYTSRYDGPDLLPEERDVKAALARCCMPSSSDSDWTPITPLYLAYVRRHLERFQTREALDDHPKLTRRQFGHALRRVYPGIRRCKRAASFRRKCWGYAGLSGPFSIITPPPRTRVNHVA